jgi:hypothetical protein
VANPADLDALIAEIERDELGLRYYNPVPA